MRTYQLEFDFTDPDDALLIKQQTEAALSTMTDIDSEWYRINKYADWWCDRVPRFMGYGIYDGYRNFRRWCISSYQKFRYGVSDEECWNLSNNIAQYILPRLKHFRNMERMGIPGNMFVKHHNINTEEENLASKNWNAILDELIWTFEYIIDDERFNPMPSSKQFYTLNVNDMEGWIGREKSPEEKALWDAYIEKSQQLEERKNKGLALFAKYFDNLWD
jgi:hypothetical protein